MQKKQPYISNKGRSLTQSLSASEPPAVLKKRLFSGQLAAALIFNLAQLACFNTAALAQQTIQDQAGSPFMEEVTDGKSAPPHSISPASPHSGQAQTIQAENGSMFMEEVPQKKKSRSTPSPSIDYSNLGVPVDSSGKIIPLIQPGAGPVMPNFSRLEVDYTPPTIYVPYSTYSGPYGYVPHHTPFGTYPVPVYQAQQNGVMAVPLGIPRSFTSSSDSSPGSQQTNFQFSGSYVNGTPGASIWSPGWNSPWGGPALLPQVTQFEQKGRIQSFFPPDLNH